MIPFPLTIAAVAISVLAAGGGFYLYKESLRAEGEKRCYAALQEQQEESDKETARLVREGQEQALRLAAKADKRRQTAEAALATLKLARKEESDARAKMDPEFRDWSAIPVPAYVDQRLRDHAKLAADAAGRPVVPRDAGLPADQPVAADPDAVNESWIDGIRRKFIGLFSG